MAVKFFDGEIHSIDPIIRELKSALTAAMSCNNVCRIHGVTAKNGRLCILMQRFEKSLEDLVQQDYAYEGNGMPLAKALPVLLLAARGLQQLHDHARLAHLDIKPDNLLVNDGGSEVGWSLQKTSTFTRSNVSGLTVRYGSPEHFDYENVPSFPADTWAFGLTIAYTLTGSVASFYPDNVTDVNVSKPCACAC